ncbi:hypothetical protein K0M31_000161 [Melipona bicolor]|uniref:Uncharacterized protein n=1 Tax=Melipona bicolor TaxID=60889 RepID=A0AA40KWD8_9HYME|nr:hypothetical protein K0M31_000161 [Melipona bicolor]
MEQYDSRVSIKQPYSDRGAEVESGLFQRIYPISAVSSSQRRDKPPWGSLSYCPVNNLDGFLCSLREGGRIWLLRCSLDTYFLVRLGET